jgi:hypothetical protein
MSFAASRYFEDESGNITRFEGDRYLVRYDETLCAVLRGTKCTEHHETLEHLRETMKRFHTEYAVTTGEALAATPKFVHASADANKVYVTVVKKKANECTVLQETQPVVSASSNYSASQSFGYYSEQCDGLPWE